MNSGRLSWKAQPPVWMTRPAQTLSTAPLHGGLFQAAYKQQILPAILVISSKFGSIKYNDCIKVREIVAVVLKDLFRTDLGYHNRGRTNLPAPVKLLLQTLSSSW